MLAQVSTEFRWYDWMNPLAWADQLPRDVQHVYENYFTTGTIPTPVQSTFTPAAPRSRAEMQSGWWTPEDALNFGREEQLRQIINRNQNPSAPAVTPKPDESDNTMLWILGAVAVTGVLIAVVRK